MFNLEPAIAEWRQKMLAAGIETPVPLEELEGHLREDVERQVENGLSTQEAFEIAAQRIGQGAELEGEFGRAGGKTKRVKQALLTLASMKPLKIFTIIVGALWVAFVDILIINLFTFANPFFLISAVIQVLLTKLAIGICLYQLILIHRADISESISAIQETIARLKSSTLWMARLLFLQLPVWTTFYWNASMLKNGNVLLYVVQIIITISFTLLAVWLFFNIRYENRGKKWFPLILNGAAWSPLTKSMELLGQINE